MSAPPQLSERPATWALKVAMAITGTIWILFVLIHLFGNLKLYMGAEGFNEYAFWLRHAFEPLLPEEFLLWALRIVLIISLVIHVGSAAILWSRGRRARGRFRSAARKRRTGFASISAALMPLTGIIILGFLIFHVLDLTTGTGPAASTEFAAHTGTESFAYQNLIASFSRLWVAILYTLTMVLLSIHTAHGITTAATDLGAMGYRLRQIAAITAGIVAIVILLGNASIPIAVQLGVLS